MNQFVRGSNSSCVFIICKGEGHVGWYNFNMCGVWSMAVLLGQPFEYYCLL